MCSRLRGATCTIVTVTAAMLRTPREADKGQVCDQKRNIFVVQDTVILESNGPVGVWKDEEIDPSAEFRAHFEGGDPKADVPDLLGVGLMSDGDQTNSISAADYAGFVLIH